MDGPVIHNDPHFAFAATLESGSLGYTVRVRVRVGVGVRVRVRRIKNMHVFNGEYLTYWRRIVNQK